MFGPEHLVRIQNQTLNLMILQKKWSSLDKEDVGTIQSMIMDKKLCRIKLKDKVGTTVKRIFRHLNRMSF